MKTLNFWLLTIYMGVFFAQPSLAEVSNGRACKNHLAPIFEITHNSHLYNEINGMTEFTNVLDVKFSVFRNTDASDRPEVNRYLRRVRETLNACFQHCQGLLFANGEPFNCAGLNDANIGELQTHLPDLADNATVAEEGEDLDAAFGGNTEVPEPSATEVEEEEAPTPVVETGGEDPINDSNPVIDDDETMDDVLERLRRRKRERENQDIAL